jgi:large subunit ribosomal protein L10
MPKTRVQKEETVQQLQEKLAKANSIVFADYKGMTMTQLSGLRKDLKEMSAEFMVTKNNLLKIALKESKMEVSDDILAGPIATLFSFGDEISPIKVLTKAIKDNQVGKVIGGVMEGEVLDQAKVNKLAQLPSKDELRAKVVGGLGAPLYGIVGVLQANLRNLVYVMDQVRIQKGGE